MPEAAKPSTTKSKPYLQLKSRTEKQCGRMLVPPNLRHQRDTTHQQIRLETYLIPTSSGKWRHHRNLWDQGAYTNWSFTVADVKTPLLGADFLAHYNLAVHMKARTLSDNTTSIKITGIPSSFNTTRISVATQHDPRYVEILRRYKHLTQPIKPTDAGDHQTQHHIKTTGQPASSRPRRLPPHKLAYAKKAFEEMLADNIIRPSDSPYASPLHLATHCPLSSSTKGDSLSFIFNHKRRLTVLYFQPLKATHCPLSSSTKGDSLSFIFNHKRRFTVLYFQPLKATHCPLFSTTKGDSLSFIFINKRRLTVLYLQPQKAIHCPLFSTTKGDSLSFIFINKRRLTVLYLQPQKATHCPLFSTTKGDSLSFIFNH
ncbi:unnamed protein product [Acanthosepion pharaonis]|uniref:Uncharacterized protein n=1 Tax=Acanthosepion pharaonis TaxID=158019 RepID=A0A812CAD2_ACAPH|nr:unnamed protein product [Sepia pharaonis]